MDVVKKGIFLFDLFTEILIAKYFVETLTTPKSYDSLIEKKKSVWKSETNFLTLDWIKYINKLNLVKKPNEN